MNRPASTDCPVASTNFDSNRKQVDLIVLHTMDGYKAGTRAVFARVGSQVSAHDGVNIDGSIDQFVDDDKVAYHCGVKGKPESYSWNQRSVGIETEDLHNPYKVVRPDVQYEAIAQLVAYYAWKFTIPLILITDPNQRGIIKHTTLNPAKGCPGNLDVVRIINRAKEILNQSIVQEPTVMQTGQVITNVNIRNAPTINSFIIQLARTGQSVNVVGAINGESFKGNAVWYKLADGSYVWSGAINLAVPQPQPTELGANVQDTDILNAGIVIKQALPQLEAIEGGRFGNAEGAARQMAHEWNNLITARKQAKGVVDSLIKLFKL